MYIFEAITKFIKGKKYKFDSNYLPNNKEELSSNPQDCEHCFLPLDSSNELFACKYCGIVASKDKLKDRNIFRNK